MSKTAVQDKQWNALHDKATSFAFVVPAIVIFSLFYIYPFIKLFILSFMEWPGIGPSKFIGFQHFIELAGDKIWWRSMWNATYITLIALIFQNALAFLLALACDREIRGKNFYRVIFFIPPVLSEVIVGMIWRWILDEGMQGGQYIGLFNHFLVQIGFPHLVNNWLSNPETSLTCIALIHSWKGFGWGFLILLAGLQTIDGQLYEASKVDGANSWQRFVHVTIPMMMPVITVVGILTILGSMQAFVLILSLVGKGLVYYTDVPVTRILEAMRSTSRYGYASAMAVNFGAILVLVSFALKKISDKAKQV